MKLADEASTGVVRRPSLSEEVERTTTPGSALEQAVARMLDTQRVPELVFQPVVDLQRGAVVGYEVLSRFSGPPAATPDKWFAAAKSLGRAPELEARVIREALSRRHQVPANSFLSINVAPEALLSDGVRALLRTGSLTGVVFELTEHSAVTDYDLLARAIGEAKEQGAFVAVDDAGAGYASLQHILMLRPDFVKLDRALIAGLSRDEAKAALVEMFGGFTSRIDAWLLAEGIEEHEELQRLVQLGVPLGQGYLLGRPERGMRTLDARLMERLQRMARVEDGGRTLLASVELFPVASAAWSEQQLLTVLKQRPDLRFVPLLDAAQRPVALAVRHGSRELKRRPALVVLESSLREEALERALTREESRRFDPLLCCDESGQYRGIVRIERLVESLLKGARD